LARNTQGPQKKHLILERLFHFGDWVVTWGGSLPWPVGLKENWWVGYRSAFGEKREGKTELMRNREGRVAYIIRKGKV